MGSAQSSEVDPNEPRLVTGVQVPPRPVPHFARGDGPKSPDSV